MLRDKILLRTVIDRSDWCTYGFAGHDSHTIARGQGRRRFPFPSLHFNTTGGCGSSSFSGPCVLAHVAQFRKEAVT